MPDASADISPLVTRARPPRAVGDGGIDLWVSDVAGAAGWDWPVPRLGRFAGRAARDHLGPSSYGQDNSAAAAALRLTPSSPSSPTGPTPPPPDTSAPTPRSPKMPQDDLSRRIRPAALSVAGAEGLWPTGYVRTWSGGHRPT